MDTYAVLVAIALSVCHGQSSIFYAQKCHSHYLFGKIRVCNSDFKPAVCNDGVISIVALEYKDDNLNIGSGSCCMETDGTVSAKIKHTLNQECNNKSTCNFDSVTSGTLEVKYTCTVIQVRTVTMTSLKEATATSPLMTNADLDYTVAKNLNAYSNPTGATTEATTLTTNVSLATVASNPYIYSNSSTGLQPQILNAIIAVVAAVCTITAGITFFVCKIRKQRKPITSTDDYELESSPRVPNPAAAVPFVDPEEINTPSNEQDHEYDTTMLVINHTNVKKNEGTYDVALTFSNHKHVTKGEDHIYDVATNLPQHRNSTIAVDQDYSMTIKGMNQRTNGDDDYGYKTCSNFINSNNATRDTEDNTYDLVNHNINKRIVKEEDEAECDMTEHCSN